VHHLDLDTLTLAKGNHTTPDDGLCLLEAVSYFANEPHSDHPACASPVLVTYGISLNDQWDAASRQKLKPFIPRIVGTAGDGQDEARSFLALDWLIRTYTPAFLDLVPSLASHAAGLRDHRRIVDSVAAQSIRPLVKAAGTDAAAAAAGDAAWAAA